MIPKFLLTIMHENLMAARSNHPIRKRRRRTRSKGQDQRATALYLAGIELLANSDFENVPIARIAKTAGCSVGAFYYRHKDKNAYLCQLISMTFGRFENSLENHLSNSKGRISVSEFLTFIIERLSAQENAGIIRATLKLGATEPDALQPYSDFREYVAAKAENIFKSGAKKKIHTKEIRGALQIVFASLNDAALMPKSAKLKLGSNEMKNALCKISAGHIGVNSNFLGRIPKTITLAENRPLETSEIKNMEISGKKNRSAKHRGGKMKVL